MSRGPDASTLLQRALLRNARQAGCTLAIAAAHATRWASATFAGTQHRLTLDAVDDGSFQSWQSRLNDAELPLRGHLLADVATVTLARTDGRAIAVIEALTVEE